ncbi:MAG TPA: transglutaminase-like domain-containing protein [Thermoleophilia bacterium]|nr:transglutaminase-like domain-containing protein [Thermoleophilia bacterium]
MRTATKILYLASFAALAVVTALAAARVARPSIASAMVAAALLATLAGAPGLIHRRAWPAALILLPAGAYLVMRALIPLPASAHGLGGQLGFYLGQLRAGAHAYSTRTFPLQLAGAPGLKLLLVVIVYTATGLAALAAVGLRRALAAVVVFLVVLGFSLTVDGTGSVVLVPLAFLFLTGCLLALSRSVQRARGAPAGVVTGAATAVAATCAALFLLVATPVAASKPWQDWSTWGPVGPGTSRLAFNWMLNFPNLLDPKHNATVLEIQSPVASYWRANALDSFTGQAWLSAGSPALPLVSEGVADPDTYDVPATGTQPSGAAIVEVFRLRALSTDYLVSGGTTDVVVVGGGRAPVFIGGSNALRLPQPLGPRSSYAVTAEVPHVTPADLVARGRDYPVQVTADLALPFPTAAAMTGPDPAQEWRATMSDTSADREWRGLYQLNRQIVGTATDPYQITLRIEQYLRLHYLYSLAPPQTRYASPYAAFLFDTRTGYCQHFAGAMAALERFNGIPARVAVGFTAGDLVGRNTFRVSRTNAHAWVEVYFPQVGWIAFEPTPGDDLPGVGPSSTNAGFVSPYPGDNDSSIAAAAGTASPKLQGIGSGPNARQKGTGLAPSGSSSHHTGWLLPWALGLVAVMIAWPLGRAAVRRRGLHGGTREARLRAGLALLYGDLRDHGVGVPRSQTLSETTALLSDRYGLDASPLTERIEAVLFGGRPCAERDLADLARLRHDLRRRLRERSGTLRALGARYGLRLAPR